MKKLLAILLGMTLLASTFSALCGCNNNKEENKKTPTVMNNDREKVNTATLSAETEPPAKTSSSHDETETENTTEPIIQIPVYDYPEDFIDDFGEMIIKAREEQFVTVFSEFAHCLSAKVTMEADGDDLIITYEVDGTSQLSSKAYRAFVNAFSTTVLADSLYEYTQTDLEAFQNYCPRIRSLTEIFVEKDGGTLGTFVAD